MDGEGSEKLVEDWQLQWDASESLATIVVVWRTLGRFGTRDMNEEKGIHGFNMVGYPQW